MSDLVRCTSCGRFILSESDSCPMCIAAEEFPDRILGDFYCGGENNTKLTDRWRGEIVLYRMGRSHFIAYVYGPTEGLMEHRKHLFIDALNGMTGDCRGSLVAAGRFIPMKN